MRDMSSLITTHNEFSGAAQITDEGIKDHFKKFDPIQAIFELVWNGLDANATLVKIEIKYNELGGLDYVSILDNGEGIDVSNIDENFERFNESSKKHNEDKHGSHGKGRLSFHKLCRKAVWYTKRHDYNVVINIDGNSIKQFNGSYIEKTNQNKYLTAIESGTYVELLGPYKDLPLENKIIEKLSKEFGWFLAINNDRNIYINNSKIETPLCDIYKDDFDFQNEKFKIIVIRWNEKPTSAKSYNYFIENKSRVVYKEYSKFNNKKDFYISSYISSNWFNSYNHDILPIDPNYNNTRKFITAINNKLYSIQSEIYSEFLKKYVDKKICEFEEQGLFPRYDNLPKEYAEFREKHTKELIKNIYLADPIIFNSLNKKQKSIFIRLLDRISVSNENNYLFDILESVLELSPDDMKRFAGHLQRTSFEHIISTIEVLQQRELSVHKLSEIMEKRYKDVGETPDLQKIIENNTWLFGPQYTTIGAEEDTFSRIAKELKKQIKEEVSEADIAEGADIEGVNKQVDLFLARKIPSYDSQGNQIYKCVIIEIKRPGVSLNKKHLYQLDEYAEIIEKHPAFSSQKMRFDLILIGRKISREDKMIHQRLSSLKDKAELGLITDSDRIKCYVKDWFTIFDEFRLSNDYLLKTLNTKLDNLSKESTEDLVSVLQTQPR
ncbi:Histidine kinase-, DNA gyrase B-, and HSP90-like ATPase [Candidatus Electrothrix aarhusensis]|uniref:Histidine kinase-, DNA gyrase B-, and HSP90-like ATPase n=1 Tax=Candidatus Electrothrix aarhusensis TaxID=1859131 RepID=A0A444IXQ5_9BACT|nr:Histidine kinase-, DNA gyrase B-, and HSP90-like ATPase [Candidatus Electrothrix aarhusensis]